MIAQLLAEAVFEAVEQRVAVRVAPVRLGRQSGRHKKVAVRVVRVGVDGAGGVADRVLEQLGERTRMSMLMSVLAVELLLLLHLMLLHELLLQLLLIVEFVFWFVECEAFIMEGGGVCVVVERRRVVTRLDWIQIAVPNRKILH